MNEQERTKLLFDLEMLKMLLDFRVKNPKNSFKSQKEFEEYIDAILDEINEINRKLNEPPRHE